MGSYTDSNGAVHGFLYSGGVYTTLDFPTAAVTFDRGINDSASIVGGYNYGNGFLASSVPEPSTLTLAGLGLLVWYGWTWSKTQARRRTVPGRELGRPRGRG